MLKEMIMMARTPEGWRGSGVNLDRTRRKGLAAILGLNLTHRNALIYHSYPGVRQNSRDCIGTPFADDIGTVLAERRNA
jgi:hypothetical protein